MVRHLVFAFLLVTALAANGLAEQGVLGRASLGGTLVDKIEVRAYRAGPGEFGPLTGQEPEARTVTGVDGTYRLRLAPGRYVIEAIKKKAPGAARPEPGDLYCLYSGSPVNVVNNKWTGVGLYLVEVPDEKSSDSGVKTALSGKLTFKGEAVGRSYLYIYKDASGAFRGPADLLQPVADGTFSVRLPPGEYYLVARKRARGGAYGPIDTGDLFNFYPMNPVVLEEGRTVSVEIPLVERLDQLEEVEGAYKGFSIKVTDPSGKPLAGKYVLAYTVPMRSGPPAGTAGPTGEDGVAWLNVGPEAKYLRVRPVLGGPPGEGEIFTDAVVEPGEEGVTVILEEK